MWSQCNRCNYDEFCSEILFFWPNFCLIRVYANFAHITILISNNVRFLAQNRSGARFSELGSSRSSGCRFTSITPTVYPFIHPKNLGFARISCVVSLEAGVQTSNPPPAAIPGTGYLSGNCY